MFIMTGSRGQRGRNNSIAKRGALLKTTAVAGSLEYDGKVFYNTPQGAQRGVDPSMQFFRLNAALAGADATGAQSMFGKSVTLSSSTVYAFTIAASMTKSAGTVSHTVSIGFGGTATLNNIGWSIVVPANSGAPGGNLAASLNYRTAATAVAFVAATTLASVYATFQISGTVSVNVGGTFIPQYTLSAAPGGAYSTDIGSYMTIYPIGAAGADVNVGTWA